MLPPHHPADIFLRPGKIILLNPYKADKEPFKQVAAVGVLNGIEFLQHTHVQGLAISASFNRKQEDAASASSCFPCFYDRIASYTRRISPTLQAWAKHPREDVGFSPS